MRGFLRELLWTAHQQLHGGVIQLMVETDGSHICNYYSKCKGNNNMIKPIIRYFAKKYVAAMVSDLLEAASKKTDLELWKSRVKKVIQLC